MLATATQGPFFAASQIAGNLLDMGAPPPTSDNTLVCSPRAGEIRFVRANRAEHYDAVHRLMCDVFSQQEPITRAIGATSSDVDRFYRDICDGCLDGPYSILALDGDRIIGLSLNYAAAPKKPTTEAGLRLKADYAEDIAKGPYDNHASNRLLVFIEEVERNYVQFLPRCKKFFKIDILFVHPEYTGRGLAKKMVETVLELARDHHCQYAVSCITAAGSGHILNKFGFACVREVPFASFRENGVPVYQGLHDGNQSAKLMVLKLGSSVTSVSSMETVPLSEEPKPL